LAGFWFKLRADSEAAHTLLRLLLQDSAFIKGYFRPQAQRRTRHRPLCLILGVKVVVRCDDGSIRLPIVAVLVLGLLLTTPPASARQQPRSLASVLPGSAPVYFPFSCEKVKSPLDYHILLPSAPDATLGNVATQWGLAD
jgi:hypothetical protein